MRGCLVLALTLAACGGKTGSPSTMDQAGNSMGGASNASGGATANGGASHCTFKGFAAAVTYAVANEPQSIIAIDRTHSGHLDLVVGERGADVYPSELFVNKGDGTFTASANYGAPGNYVGSMVAGDFNGDGELDLASLANGAPEVDPNDHTTGLLGIDFGIGNGMFASSLVTFPTPQAHGYFAVSDFNGDGHPDLAFAGYDYVMVDGFVTDAGGLALPGPEPTNYALSVFFNLGDGTFGAPTTYTNQDWLQFGNFSPGDFDGDGHVDLAELSSRESGVFGVFFNAGDGTFRDEAAFTQSNVWGTYGLGVADFNGDGKDDVATATIVNANLPDEANLLEIFNGAGDGSFDGPVSTPITDIPAIYQMVTGDFNGDGFPDLATVQKNQWGEASPIPIAVFENLGDGTFGAPVNYDVGGQMFQYVIAIAAGDFNGDGVTDLAVTTSGEESTPNPESVTVLLSQCQ